MKRLLAYLFIVLGLGLVVNNFAFAKCIKGDCINGYGTYRIGGYGYEYVGGFKNGEFHGQGTETGANGYKYVGGWKDGKKHGQGTDTYSGAGKYVGGWKDDKKHGQGTYTYPSGSKYVGEFKNGIRHGQGTFTFADGTVDNGIWKNGKLVEPNNIKTQIVKKEPKKKTSDDLVKQLKDLNELYESGVLTEEEFVKIKQKLLN